MGHFLPWHNRILLLHWCFLSTNMFELIVFECVCVPTSSRWWLVATVICDIECSQWICACCLSSACWSSTRAGGVHQNPSRRTSLIFALNHVNDVVTLKTWKDSFLSFFVSTAQLLLVPHRAERSEGICSPVTVLLQMPVWHSNDKLSFCRFSHGKQDWNYGINNSLWRTELFTSTYSNHNVLNNSSGMREKYPGFYFIWHKLEQVVAEAQTQKTTPLTSFNW